jgi:hypothetical protein
MPRVHFALHATEQTRRQQCICLPPRTTAAPLRNQVNLWPQRVQQKMQQPVMHMKMMTFEIWEYKNKKKLR